MIAAASILRKWLCKAVNDSRFLNDLMIQNSSGNNRWNQSFTS